MQHQQALDAIRHIAAGQGSAADIRHIFVQLEGIGLGLADQVLAPGGAAYLVAVGFAVVEYLHPEHLAIR